MLRRFLWGLILTLLLVACQPIAALPSQAESEAGSYADPDGQFVIPLPSKWTAESAEGRTRLQSPNGLIEVYLLVLEGVKLEDAAAEAWAKVDPTFSLTPSLVEEAPSRPGITRSLYHDYVAGEGQTVLAIAEALGNQVYVTLVRGDAQEVAKRTTQINIILSGLTLTGVAEVDLRGVMPLTLTPAHLDAFRAYVEDARVRLDVPGAALAVVQDGEVILLEGFGVRQRGSDAPMTPQSQMMIGSINKTMTTMLMAQLVDEGLMAWERPVQSILPNFAVADPEISARLTVRNLVCACTGVPRRDLEYFFNANEMTAEKVIDSLRTFEFYTGFGEAFQYSNQLVATAGWVAAAAAGGKVGELDQAYLTLMQERIFGPIGMEKTTFSFEEVMASDDVATPHSLSLTGMRTPLPVDADRLLLGIAPAGAAWSTAEDMSRYLLTEMNQGVTPDGVRVVSAQNLAETWKPQVAVNGTASYGLGWFVDSYKKQLMLHHGGNTSGFSSQLTFLPESKLGIVVLTNGRLANAFTQAVTFRLLELAFEQAQEYDAQAAFAHAQTVELSLAPLADAVAVDKAWVAPYLGTYSHAALGEVVLKLEEGKLILDSGELVMEVLAVVDAEGAPSSYVINSYIGPVLGVAVQLLNDAAGNPQVTLVKGVDKYSFTVSR